MPSQVTADIPPQQDLITEIDRLKRTKRMVILAHYYQEDGIQDMADFIGDSLGLAQQAQKTTAEVIVFAGVHFMAETAKILNPTRKVVVPDLAAGCSLADSMPAEALAAWRKAHPDHYVVSYINCTAAAKALSDIICTSSNAVKVVQAAPKDRPLLFAPDRHLGAWVRRQTGREMDLWQGTCIVHESFSLRALLRLKQEYPKAEVIAHPECDEALLAHADFIGSTTALLNRTRGGRADVFIVATEPGILHAMRRANPDKTYLPLPGTEESCACNQCPYMRLNTLEKLYRCMALEAPEVEVPPDLREKARVPIERMLALS